MCGIVSQYPGIVCRVQEEPRARERASVLVRKKSPLNVNSGPFVLACGGLSRGEGVMVSFMVKVDMGVGDEVFRVW